MRPPRKRRAIRPAALRGLATTPAPGSESRHNLAYWRYADYAGIGPGAHGRLTLPDGALATRRHRAPEAWAERVERDGHGTRQQDLLDPPTRAREMLLMGLRLSEGVSLDRLAARTGVTLADATDAGVLDHAIGEGYLTLADGVLRATQEGRKRLDALLAALLT